MTVFGTVADEAAHIWRARMDEGLSSIEKQEFDSWLQASLEHRLAFANAEVAWGALGRVDYAKLASNSADDPPAEHAPELAATFAEPNYANDNLLGASWTKIATSLAACVVALIAASSLWFSQIAQVSEPERELIVTAGGVAKSIELPDRSRIRLSPNSRLDFVYLYDRRDIRLLEGRARFTVRPRPDQPFLVRTMAAQIRVTGTQFLASLSGEELEIRVTEGSVDLLPSDSAITDDSSLSLKAGDAIRTRDGVEIVRLDQPRGAIAAPTRKLETPERLDYVGTPLSQVVADINRLGGGPIAVDPSVASLRLSGSFGLDQIDTIPAVIDAALPVDIEQRDGKRFIVPE